jgi:hypothetical protein
MAGGIGFQLVNRPSAFIYMDLERATTGALKLFMGRAAYMGSDWRRIWPETIKSLDFYGFRPFTITARDAIRVQYSCRVL